MADNPKDADLHSTPTAEEVQVGPPLKESLAVGKFDAENRNLVAHRWGAFPRYDPVRDSQASRYTAVSLGPWPGSGPHNGEESKLGKRPSPPMLRLPFPEDTTPATGSVASGGENFSPSPHSRVGHPDIGPAGPPHQSPSETMSGTENDQIISGAISAHKGSRRPNGEGKCRESRKLLQEDIGELREVIRVWRDLARPLSVNLSLQYALEYIQTIRDPVYPRPCVATGESRRRVKRTVRADQELTRREEERRLYGKISKYYEMKEKGGKKLVWKRPPLVKEVLKDLKVRHPPIGIEAGSGP